MAKRRAAGEGTIGRAADGRWWARIDLGFVNGKRKRKIYGKTQAEVVAKMAKVRRDVQMGTLATAPEKLTVEACVKEWLGRGPELLKIRPSTHASYCQFARLYVLPQLAHVSLVKLSPTHLNRAYAALLESGKSARTVQYAHTILHRVLKDAVRANLIPRNPADFADAPRPQRREIAPPGQEQLMAFLQVAKKDRLFALYLVDALCGLRQGELLALKWTDLNLEDGELHVRRKVYRIRVGAAAKSLGVKQDYAGFYVSEPKTKKGLRMIALPAAVVEALRNHHVLQAQERLAAGPAWQDEGWVFPTTTGRLIDCTNLFHGFKALLEEAGLPSTTRFHDLRHAMATMMLEDNVHPKVVQERLGHSSISVTLDVYSHIKPKLQHEAAQKLGERFNGLV
ncbi:MAG: tyrosine-type recombinase/integrase [Candidatus Xenobia bacterium]